MGSLGHKGHFKLDRWRNRRNMSKQSSEVEERHWAQREMLVKMAGGREGADTQQELRHIRAGKHREDPKALPWAPSAILDTGPPALRPGRSMAPIPSTLRGHCLLLTWGSPNKDHPHHWVTWVTVPYNQRSLPTEMWYPSEDLESSENSKRWPLTRWPWS